MEPLSIPQVLLLFVVGQGLFLSVILFAQKKGDIKANRFLSVAVFLMTYFTFVFFLNDSGYRRFVPILIVNGYSIAPLIPVMFYFYFRQLISGSLGKNYPLHFIPFIIQFLYWLPNNSHGLFHTLSDEVFDIYYSVFIVRSVSSVHILIYWSYAYVFFKKMNFHSKTIPDERGIWLRRIRSHYVVMAMFFTAGLLALWLIADSNTIRYGFFLFLSFFIYLIGYYGYTQSEKIFPLENLKPKYYHSNLTSEESRSIYGSLLQLMEEQRVYLNPEIKIADVAHTMAIPSHYLSQVINENYGQNFLDFINKYRIEEAKNILTDKNKGSLKMLAVALDAGFSNKVSFYKNFKKFTGVLPSEYRNVNQSRQEPTLV